MILHTPPTPDAAGPGSCAQLACLTEASARKVGNVHPQASFADLTYSDFITSALTIAPLLDVAAQRGVGQTILACVRATREAVGTNSNLGIVLLLTPLCATPSEVDLRLGVREVLANLTDADTAAVYEAIRLAQPGGLSRVAEADVHDAPTVPLLQAMRLAAGRDQVARQYAHDFSDIFETVTPRLLRWTSLGFDVETAVVGTHLQLLADEPDSLIVRKSGPATGLDVQKRAAAVLDADWPGSDESRRRFDALDAFLREEGHRRNPGSTADLVTAGLFVALRTGQLAPPSPCAS